MDQGLLSGLGLEQKEILAYLGLLELGEGTVQDIAKKSNIKRPTAYLVLAALESKGFVNKTLRGKKTYYAPQHPQKLITEAELRLRELRETVPQLETLLQKGSGRPRITIYEGKERLDMAFDEMFVAKGENMYMGTLALSADTLPRTYRKLSYAELSSQFHIRELIDDSEQSRKYAAEVQKEFREIRFLPKEFLPFEVDIGIFGNKVLITSVKKEYFTVALESDEIHAAFQSIFSAIWNIAQKAPTKTVDQ